jgi:hypothetical protein
MQENRAYVNVIRVAAPRHFRCRQLATRPKQLVHQGDVLRIAHRLASAHAMPLSCPATRIMTLDPRRRPVLTCRTRSPHATSNVDASRQRPGCARRIPKCPGASLSGRAGSPLRALDRARWSVRNRVARLGRDTVLCTARSFKSAVGALERHQLADGLVCPLSAATRHTATHVGHRRQLHDRAARFGRAWRRWRHSWPRGLGARYASRVHIRIPHLVPAARGNSCDDHDRSAPPPTKPARLAREREGCVTPGCVGAGVSGCI